MTFGSTVDHRSPSTVEEASAYVSPRSSQPLVPRELEHLRTVSCSVAAALPSCHDPTVTSEACDQSVAVGYDEASTDMYARRRFATDGGRDRRRQGGRLPVSAPVRVAVRTGPHGRTRGPTSARTLGRQDQVSIHRGEPIARVCLGEAGLTRDHPLMPRMAPVECQSCAARKAVAQEARSEMTAERRRPRAGNSAEA